MLGSNAITLTAFVPFIGAAASNVWDRFAMV